MQSITGSIRMGSRMMSLMPLCRRPQIATAGGTRFYAASSRRLPFEPPTYNELPVPDGSWDNWYKKENERYNKHLFLGVTFFIITLFAVSKVAYFNFYPPPVPDMIDESCPVVIEQKKC